MSNYRITAMLPSQPESLDTLEEDLGNLSLLEILLISIVLIVTIPIGFAIEWFKQIYKYLKNFPDFKSNYFKNRPCR
jgi:hypothetical protein